MDITNPGNLDGASYGVAVDDANPSNLDGESGEFGFEMRSQIKAI